jgi:hypothetical protein
MEDVITEVMIRPTTSQGMLDLWQTEVISLFPYLTVTNIRSWYDGSASVLRGSRGDPSLLIYIICQRGFQQWMWEIQDSGIGFSVMTCSATSIVFCKNNDEKTIERRNTYHWEVTYNGVTYSGDGTNQPVRVPTPRSSLCP